MDKNVKKIERSSFLLSKILDRPDVYGNISIDMLSITLPVPENEAKKLLALQRQRTADCSVKLTNLTGKDAGSQKFKRRLDFHFSNESTLSVLIFGLNKRQNQVKIVFNPNSVGPCRLAKSLNLIMDLWGESNYRLWMLRANVTRVDYVIDLPDIPIQHVITDYAYRSPYEAFFNNTTFTGFRYGTKAGCPIIFYDKVLEQSGFYRSYREYTRIEKQHKPRARGSKSMFKVAEMDEQKYSFQGLSFYDPKILIKMPERVSALIVKYGIGKAITLLDDVDGRILSKRMTRRKLAKSPEFKSKIENSFQEQLRQLKELLVEPSYIRYQQSRIRDCQF